MRSLGKLRRSPLRLVWRPKNTDRPKKTIGIARQRGGSRFYTFLRSGKRPD
jgi:hypothetical protein